MTIKRTYIILVLCGQLHNAAYLAHVNNYLPYFLGKCSEVSRWSIARLQEYFQRCRDITLDSRKRVTFTLHSL